MEQRLFRILNSLVGEDFFMSKLVGVEKFDDGMFDLKIELADPNMSRTHRTFLRFSDFDDGKKISIGIEHLWGWLDTGIPNNDLLNQLIASLRKNTNTWEASNLFLGIREFDGVNHLNLNCSDCFLAKWDDADIRELLGQRIVNIGTSFMMYDTTLTALHNNYEGD